ncbi:MAG: ABC transporter substrate-binding protein [Pyrobaculum sp.]
MDRREVIKLGAVFVIGLAAGFGAGYMSKPSVGVVKEGEVVETITPRRTEAKKREFKLGVVTFLSGAASIFGVPSANMARLIVDLINANGGINGAKVVMDVRDEAGGADKMVALYRELTQQAGVDAYVGLVSSADCLAVASVAEELGSTLTVFYDCATKRLVDDNMMRKVVFRTGGTTVVDGASLARFVLEVKPDVKTVVGLNQDYAYGRDEWHDFITVLKRLKPDVEVLDELWTPLFTADYSAQISKILALRPDIVHTSFWGPDLVNFVSQAAARGLFATTTVAFARGESMLQELKDTMPVGQLVEGPHYFEYPSTRFNPLNKTIVEEYFRRYGLYPPYPAYHMANAILGVKYAYEAASAVSGEDWPDLSTVVKVFERLAYPSPGDYIIMTPNHNAYRGAVVGVTANVPGYGFRLLRPFKYIPPTEVNPPVGVRSDEWFKSI